MHHLTAVHDVDLVREVAAEVELLRRTGGGEDTGAQRVRGANPPKTKPTNAITTPPPPPERPVWRPKKTSKDQPKSPPDSAEELS